MQLSIWTSGPSLLFTCALRISLDQHALFEASRSNSTFCQATEGHTKALCRSSSWINEPIDAESCSARRGCTVIHLCCQTFSQVLEEMHAAEITAGPLRDHRALCCNVDDYARMVGVPCIKGANFRTMPGVITHANGKSCEDLTDDITVESQTCSAAISRVESGACLTLLTRSATSFAY